MHEASSWRGYSGEVHWPTTPGTKTFTFNDHIVIVQQKHGEDPAITPLATCQRMQSLYNMRDKNLAFKADY